MATQKRRSDRCGRAPLRSPGRPPAARRENYQRFWASIAAGRSTEDAALDAGVSPPVGGRWFRRAGGMIPFHFSQSSKPLSGRYLSFAEREEIAILRVQEHGVRAIARKLGRAPSTISRELRRNAATRSGGLEYRATTAQWHADRSLRRPKPAKLVENEIAAPLCARAACRCGHRARWSKDQRAEGGMEGTAIRTQAAPAVGDGVEPGTDCQAPAARLSR